MHMYISILIDCMYMLARISLVLFVEERKKHILPFKNKILGLSCFGVLKQAVD